MSVFEKVTALFQDEDAALAFANIADAAYLASQGKVARPFGVDQYGKIMQNLAGLYAADAAAQLVVLLWYGAQGLSEQRYVKTLEELASGTVWGDANRMVGDLTANLAWRSGQPFLGLTRLKRPINKHFSLLTPEERETDRLQIKVGAQFILDWLKQSETTAAA